MTDLPKWESIFELLVRCRNATGSHSGAIEIAGHTPFPFGTWISDESTRRWYLRISSDGLVEWREHNTRGELTRHVALERDGNRFRIERSNDEEVLRFLGAGDDEVAQIFGNSPRASYMILDLSADRFSAEWHGIFWAPDQTGNIKTLEQPGTTPRTTGRPYTFSRQN